MSLRFAFSRPTSSRGELEQLFTRFRSAGYDGLQLKFSQYGDDLDRPAEFLETRGQREGAASALIFGGRLDAEGIESLRRVFRFAGKVGAEKVVFCHGVSRGGVTRGDLAAFARILGELGKEARQLGVGLSLHHHYDQPVMYREDFDVFFDALDGDSVGLTIDTAHLVKSGIRDIAEVIRSFAHVIDNFHMKDYADGEWRVLGHGAIPFAPVFEAVRAIGYSGWISADEESGGDLEQGMQACLTFLKSGLA